MEQEIDLKISAESAVMRAYCRTAEPEGNALDLQIYSMVIDIDTFIIDN